MSEFNLRSVRFLILVASVALGRLFFTEFQFSIGCRGGIAQLVYWLDVGRKVRCSNLLVAGGLLNFVHAIACAVCTGELPQVQSGWDNATSHPHLASRLRMGRALSPFCAWMACYAGDLYLNLLFSVGIISPISHTYSVHPSPTQYNLKYAQFHIQGVTGGTDQTSGGCSLC